MRRIKTLLLILGLITANNAISATFSDGTNFRDDTKFLYCFSTEMTLFVAALLDRPWPLSPYLYVLPSNTSSWSEVEIDKLSDHIVSFRFGPFGYNTFTINRTTLRSSVEKLGAIGETRGSCNIVSPSEIEVALQRRGGKKI